LCDLAFQALRPVRALQPLADVLVAGRSGDPVHLRQLERAAFRRAHVHPDDARLLARRVRAQLDALAHPAVLRLVGGVDALAVHPVFPAVVRAPQAGLLVAAEEQARQPVRALRLDDPHPAAGVAETQQVLAQQPQAHGRTVGNGLGREQRGHPETTEQLTHRAARTYPGQVGVLLGRQHSFLLFRASGR
jgi:hypothetical protein